MESRIRKKQIKLYVTEKEYNSIKIKMKQFGTEKFSIYARKMLIDGYVISINNIYEFKKLVYEVNKIGVNINQLTKLANENKSISKSIINSIIKKQEEIQQLVNAKLVKIFGDNNFK